MKPKTFIKDNDIEDTIYLDSKMIGGYADMLNIIINDPDTKYQFENFDRIELKVARMILKKYSKALKDYYKKNGITITTHKLTHKAKKYYYLDSLASYKYPLPFETIDRVEFKKQENRNIIVIEGMISVYGMSNEYGFYNIDEDEFITMDELEENRSFIIESLRGQDAIHYVKRRVRK